MLLEAFLVMNEASSSVLWLINSLLQKILKYELSSLVELLFCSYSDFKQSSIATTVEYL